MLWWEALLLFGGGALAGVINAMAGGGSILTVPLLVLAGVPGNSANGSNRVGILTSNAASAATFRKLGVDGLSHAAPVLGPAVVGSLVGSIAISRLTDDTFETVFGLLMIPLILLTIFKPKPKAPPPEATANVSDSGTAAAPADSVNSWSLPVTMAVFFGVGIYGGAVQAGVGLVMLAALTRAGFDLVLANSIKVLVSLVVTMVALPVFLIQGKVEWLPALVLAAGLTIGGWLGARIAVQGGERVIRVVMVVAAIGLAARLLGLV